MENFLKNREKEYKPIPLNGKSLRPKMLDKLAEREGAEPPLEVREITENENGEDAPKVQVVMEHNTVASILVSCSCGRHVELVCEYRR